MAYTFHLATLDASALHAVLADWKSSHPSMGVLALLPEAEKENLPTVQAACRAQAVPLVGAVFPLLLSRSGLRNQGAWLVRLDVMPPWFLLPALNEDIPDSSSSNAGERLAQAVLRLSPTPASSGEPVDSGAVPLLFLVFDAMLPNVASILADAYAQLGESVRYSGVNAGSETFKPMPCLFDDTRLVADGVLGLLLPPQAGSLSQHGFPKAKSLLKATSTTGNRIAEIDGRPAMQMYQEVILADYGVTLTPENFYEYAVHYPFGVVSLLDVQIRIPVAFQEDGSIFCVGEVPANSMLRLLQAPTLETSECVTNLAQGLRSHGAQVRGQPLFTFYCAGRRMHFGDAALLELQQLADETGAVELPGALSLGEIQSVEGWGFPEFHNANLVCLT